MSVHIRDFSVETNDQSEPAVVDAAPAAPMAAPEAASQPQRDSEFGRVLKALRCRAARLHAD